jgi:hypothetical protein
MPKAPLIAKPSPSGSSALLGVDTKIYSLRNQRVMLSHDLAYLYGIETKVLNQAVRRHLDRFPEDFCFSVTNQEVANLRSQIVTSSWGGTRYTPMAFTEQGIAMLSSVLQSPEAVGVNIQIMRSFVKLRSILAEHQDLKQQLAGLEKKYDDQFKVVFDAIRQLMTPPEPVKKKRIGFIQE